MRAGELEAADQYPTKPGGGGMCSQRRWALWSTAGPPSPGSDNTAMSAYNYFTPRAPFLLLLIPNARPGPRAFLTRGQQDACRDGHRGAKSQSNLLDPQEQQMGQHTAMIQLVPPPWLAHGARKELVQQSSGERIVHLELHQGVQSSTA